RKRLNGGARSNRRVTGYMDMGNETAALADRDMRTDHAIRTDGDVAPDLRARLDPRSRIDRSHQHFIRFAVLFRSHHGAELAFGHDFAGNLRFAAIPPHITAALEELDVKLHRVAGHHRLAEFRLVD